MGAHPIKVVFVVTGLPVGGAEIALYRLLSKLPPHIKARVICLREMDSVGRQIERQLGIEVHCLDMKPGQMNPMPVARLIRKLKELKPDVVQTWMYHADLLGGIAAKMAAPGCPVIWSVRRHNLSSSITKRSTIAVARICAWLSRAVPTKIVFNSESSRLSHMKFGYASGRNVVIPNGLNFVEHVPDADARPAIRQELGIAPTVPLVGMIARFDVVKNHAGLFQIAAMVQKNIPECHFLLAGLGVDEGNPLLSQWRREALLDSRIHLLGLRSDVPRLLAAIDVLAMPSWAEAFPNVVLEALACGTPCVVADVGDAAHILGDAGRVVPVGDNAAFSRGLEDLLRLDAGERHSIGDRGRLRAQQMFSIDQMSSRYVDLYEACMASPPAPTKLPSA